MARVAAWVAVEVVVVGLARAVEVEYAEAREVVAKAAAMALSFHDTLQ